MSAGKTIPKKSRVPSGTTQNLWCRPAGLISTHNGRPRTHVLGSDCFALRALSRQNVGTNSPPARLPMSPAPVMSNTALRRRRNDTQYVGHTYSSTLFHVVFSTKERRPAIKEPAKLWAYIAGCPTLLARFGERVGTDSRPPHHPPCRQKTPTRVGAPRRLVVKGVLRLRRPKPGRLRSGRQIKINTSRVPHSFLPLE